MEEAYVQFYTWFLAVARWLIPAIAVLLSWLWYRKLAEHRPRPAALATLVGEDGNRMPIAFCETSLGRKRSCDIQVNLPTVSRVNAVLTKEENGLFRVKDVSGHDNIQIDGAALEDAGYIRVGETLCVGGYHMRLCSPNADDQLALRAERRRGKKSGRAKPAPGFGVIVLLLSLFTLLVGLELCLKYANGLNITLPAAFGLLIVGEWVCYFINLSAGGSMRVEIPAFFLTTLGFAVCATTAPESLLKEALASAGGILVFVLLVQVLRSIRLTMKLRYAAGIGVLALLGFTLVLGETIFGSRNWIDLGFFTIQPSEFAKVAFVFAGAATLEHLLTRRNFVLFLGLSAGCFGALALMKDFGTAAIFFVTMLILIFMRTGDLKLIGVILAAAVIGIVLLIRFMPHITRRFSVWGHVWQNASDTGYQQTRTMVAIGSGGLLGTGGGNGYLRSVFAADTDLVFGMVFEEWGGIVALCAVFMIVGLAVYAVWMCRGVQSAYYAIAVTAAAGMLVFQTALNIFGSTDILPLTGVTMPFVSNGGSSIVASWGLLAFFKAADRQMQAKTVPVYSDISSSSGRRRAAGQGTDIRSGRPRSGAVRKPSENGRQRRT